ncbi:MAG: CheR family methyltransferase [Marinoscillum sp.]|uniref:CheR family methyltransferase n=1 Tax=Marinoscillum sp. TaxID=2024838 RepID=UPI0032FA3F23
MGVASMDISDIEIESFLEAMDKAYGYDFRDYSPAHIRRRLYHVLNTYGISSISLLQHHLLHDHSFAQKILHNLSIRVTEMFRDPGFYKALRETVIPLLRTWSYVKIWHAGCSTGEEVYSMAILLEEEGIYDRCQLYATDFNQTALSHAKEGIYGVDQVKKYARNYQASGGTADFSDYYYAQYESAIFDRRLSKNIVWADHNLVTDGVFAEMQVVICRNVLIYFNRDLQNRVHRLFHDSLVKGGFLCLGSKESVDFTEIATSYDALDKRQRIYRKTYKS